MPRRPEPGGGGGERPCSLPRISQRGFGWRRYAPRRFTPRAEGASSETSDVAPSAVADRAVELQEAVSGVAPHHAATAAAAAERWAMRRGSEGRASGRAGERAGRREESEGGGGRREPSEPSRASARAGGAGRSGPAYPARPARDLRDQSAQDRDDDDDHDDEDDGGEAPLAARSVRQDAGALRRCRASASNNAPSASRHAERLAPADRQQAPRQRISPPGLGAGTGARAQDSPGRQRRGVAQYHGGTRRHTQQLHDYSEYCGARD
ncbi:unnamed protein product [Lampetra planeri]